MKRYLPLIVIIALTACAPKIDPVTQAAFKSASGSVVHVVLVTSPQGSHAAEQVTALGGFPPSASVETCPRATAGQEFAIGYSEKDQPAIVVTIGATAPQVVTDKAILPAYDDKARAADGRPKHSSEATASATGGSHGDGGGSGPHAGVPKGCPFKVGMTMSQARHVIGGQPDSEAWIDGDWVWYATTMAEDVKNSVVSEGVGQITSGFGMFGSAGDVAARKAGATRSHQYCVHWTSDSDGATIKFVTVAKFN